MSALIPPNALSVPKGIWARIRAFARFAPPPAEKKDQVLYGLAQPLAGARILLADQGLLMESLIPAAVLGGFCALVASVSHDGGTALGWWGKFYKVFAVLAPLPSLIFANHYARLAAMVRWRLGFGACGPREMPMTVLVGRLVRQTAIVAVGVVPFVLVPKLIPGVGDLLASLILSLWGIHWVVADAFDDAQVLRPGESLKQSLANDRAAPPPWFTRFFLWSADRLPAVGGALRTFARLCDKLAMDSREEIHTMERHPYISAGFALSTAALMSIPVLNLFFRPVILVAASHLLGHLNRSESDHAALPEHGGQVLDPDRDRDLSTANAIRDQDR